MDLLDNVNKLTTQVVKVKPASLHEKFVELGDQLCKLHNLPCRTLVNDGTGMPKHIYLLTNDYALIKMFKVTARIIERRRFLGDFTDIKEVTDIPDWVYTTHDFKKATTLNWDKEYFEIIRIHRNDVDAAGYVSNLTDEQMEDISEYMEQFFLNSFKQAAKDACEHHNIMKKEGV